MGSIRFFDALTDKSKEWTLKGLWKPIAEYIEKSGDPNAGAHYKMLAHHTPDPLDEPENTDNGREGKYEHER